MSEAPTDPTAEAAAPELERGTYEVVRERLLERGRALGERANALNAKRLELFGGSEMAVVGSARIRTENNCVPRDIVSVGRHLLFGYNVFIGMRPETRVGDVFSLHDFVHTDDGYALEPVSGADHAFLDDPTFQADFREIYDYYGQATLKQLRVLGGKLLAVFRTGEGPRDVKVFRWAIDGEGRASYVDNRGEADHVFPPSHDFEWIRTTREDLVEGRHPHYAILDQVFVETIGGDLTIKIEDNTESGAGIYTEPVDDVNQSIEDAEIFYARVGVLILLRIRPYREAEWRHLVFNTRTEAVQRFDAIGNACVELPEDHGIIFPGGYYLQSGEAKEFESGAHGMEFLRKVRSPNGEDHLFVFYEREEGRAVLLPYNTIRQEVASPILCHGYSLFDDGELVVFRALSEEPTRVHTMQIWQTPFVTDEVAAAAPSTGSYLETIGNADLVRGISDAFRLRRAIENPEPTRASFEDLIASTQRILDHYHWLEREEVGNLAGPLGGVLETAELIIDEFEKVELLRAQAGQSLAECQEQLQAFLRGLHPDQWDSVDSYVAALAQLRRQRGHLITLRDLRYIDLARVDALEERVVEEYGSLSEAAVSYLSGPEALAPYHARITALLEQGEVVSKVTDAEPVLEGLDEISGELDTLTEVVGTLSIEDATVRTGILEESSNVFSALNRAKAIVSNRRKELASTEGKAEFGAEFKLYGQAVTSALSLADSPAKCDEQLSRLMVQLEDLENRFSEFDEFLEDLATKREDVYEAFSSRKQSLLDERQRKAEHTHKAAERILENVARRASSQASQDDLNAYFAADPMIMKVRELASRLRELGDSVRADELEGKLKATREEAGRALRDRSDIFEEGADVIKLGRHRFSVNTQVFDLTLVPRNGEMALHLTGTDFTAPVEDPEFQQTRPYWSQHLVSETENVYRGEYLAACLLADAEAGCEGRSLDDLREAQRDEQLLEIVRRYAASRYDEGYERGLHDADGAQILGQVLKLYTTAGLLRYSPRARALAALFWAYGAGSDKTVLERRAHSLGRLRAAFAWGSAIPEFAQELAERIRAFVHANALPHDPRDLPVAGEYLFEDLAQGTHEFCASAAADRLMRAFQRHLTGTGQYHDFEVDLRELQQQLGPRYALALAWLDGFLVSVGEAEGAAYRAVLEEAAMLLLTEHLVNHVVSNAEVETRVEGLLGQHPRIQDRGLVLRLDEFLARTGEFRRSRVPGYRDYQARKQVLLEGERRVLRIDEFKPKVMSSFVRNQLINEVYLPLIGDNLAKQMGALGDGKRTDLMGMLLLISPPGYGKTTLMEYVADRLGLVFMKVNGPALGHAVTSLDPDDAPNAAARQEVEKISLAFEMGSNVLLYLDDIQHTHPELLQKFISLCDGQRRVEGVWRGRTRTYDLRGKKFCVCMAGNPYTESGEKFQIPDMLANRADIYNLGDILGGNESLFALSYIENALTSNPVLSPLTTRDLADVGRLVRMAAGEDGEVDALSHDYSAGERGEILSVLRKMLRVQQVLLAVNQAYIQSASMDDAYRTEPPFKLQGSYRNMNKITEKIVPVMNDEELERLIDDHYQGESQTLTTGAESNVLKLGELRGVLSEAQQARWDQIRRDFQRVKSLGGAEDDPVVRVTSQLSLVTERLADIGSGIEHAVRVSEEAGVVDDEVITALLRPFVDRLDATLRHLAETTASLAEPEGESVQLEQTARLHRLVQEKLAEVADPLSDIAMAMSDATELWKTKAAYAPGDMIPFLHKLDQTLEALTGGEQAGTHLERLDETLRLLQRSLERGAR